MYIYICIYIIYHVISHSHDCSIQMEWGLLIQSCLQLYHANISEITSPSYYINHIPDMCNTYMYITCSPIYLMLIRFYYCMERTNSQFIFYNFGI